jgi:hypothetical protein
MIQNVWARSLLGVAFLSLALNGCAAHQDDSPSGSGEARIDGAYTTERPPSGVIRTIEFHRDGTYQLDRVCKQGSCMESGSYAINDARDSLRLTDDGTGEVTSLPFSIPGNAGATQTQALRPLDDESDELIKRGIPLFFLVRPNKVEIENRVYDNVGRPVTGEPSGARTTPGTGTSM